MRSYVNARVDEMPAKLEHPAAVGFGRPVPREKVLEDREDLVDRREVVVCQRKQSPLLFGWKK